MVGLAWLGLALDARAAENCTVNTTDFSFGVYDTSSTTPLDGTGQVAIDCQGNPLTVDIALGPGGGGTYANRRMLSGAQQMTYGLYTDLARATPWGDGNAGTSIVTCTTGVTANGCVGTNPAGGNRRATRAIYGRVPALQNVDVGTYADTVQVTVTF
ncbi:hypothetical protein LYSHEL_25630 [Lysobacter helvus]|uniref:Spore coat protein U/FanG domain-containing protein n=2 Tax=Lysobacteraceae TaxID=32033 RepID=A0ABN6FX73_9GAMM|nr:hypothetical protein LYSCAS_25630 [Lysobacter caseinilyticus]BCT96692.1 hypothetical protein LYSHEL_25630 [Lysobacter helvus]